MWSQPCGPGWALAFACYECNEANQCASCSSSLCTSCFTDSKNYLKDGLCTNECVESSTQWYDPTLGGQCKSCSISGCSSCDLYGKCTSCTSSSDTLFNGEICCDVSDGKFFNQYVGPNSCDSCFDNCKTCFGPESSQCSSCYPPYAFKPETHECKPCPDKTYFNVDKASCEDCQSNCAVCTGATTCSTCVTNYGLRGGECINCGPGSGKFLEADDSCTDCLPGCLNCDSAIACETCDIANN